MALNSSTFKLQEAFQFGNLEAVCLLRWDGNGKDIPWVAVPGSGRPLPLGTCCCFQLLSPAWSGEAKLYASGGLGAQGVLVTVYPIKVLSLWPMSWSCVSSWNFFLCFCCGCGRRLRHHPLQLRRRLLARVPLSLGVSRTSAGCARGFYSPLQRRHWEGAVPGLCTHQSPCAARQLHQLLATVSLQRRRSHHAFCSYLLWESARRAPRALRQGALGVIGVIAPAGV